MALETFPTAHELVAKLWAEGLEAEVLKKTSVFGFTGTRSDAVIQMRDRLSKEPGDVERVGLRMQDETKAITTGTAVEGNELTLAFKYMDVTLDEYAHAFKFGNVIDRQRVTFELRDEAKAALADLLANNWDTGFFNQVAGISGATTTHAGHNSITEPAAANHIFSGAAANEAALADTDVITLDDISMAVQIAKTATPGIRPAKLDGYPEPLYVVFLHPWQVFDLRQSDSRWEVLMREAMSGGMIGNNPLITGALGIWDGCLLVESSRVPTPGAGGGTGLPVIRRAILCGAQAAMCVYGRIGGQADKFRWVEKLFDFDRDMGVLGGFVGGLKKSTFGDPDGTPPGANLVDFATVVISSASPNE
jgi:N4-gp56 family major capsid protein